MKKKTLTTAAIAMALALLTASCSSRPDRGGSPEPQPTPSEQTGYDFDSIVAADHDCIASQYDAFLFLEADAEFSGLLSETENPTIDYIRTVFQHGDTCIIVEHPYKAYGEEPTITKARGRWVGCGELTARHPVTLDSCMKIIEGEKGSLPTRYLTFRRIIGPPFPEHGEYIFGHGLLFVDCQTGAVRDDRAFGGSLETVKR